MCELDKEVGPVRIGGNIPQEKLRKDWRPKPEKMGSVWEASRQGTILQVKRVQPKCPWFQVSVAGVILPGSYVSPLTAMAAAEIEWNRRPKLKKPRRSKTGGGRR